MSTNSVIFAQLTDMWDKISDTFNHNSFLIYNWWVTNGDTVDIGYFRQNNVHFQRYLTYAAYDMQIVDMFGKVYFRVSGQFKL